MKYFVRSLLCCVYCDHNFEYTHSNVAARHVRNHKVSCPKCNQSWVQPLWNLD